MDRNSLWLLSGAKDDRDSALGMDFVTRIYSPENPTSPGTAQVRDDAIFVRGNE